MNIQIIECPSSEMTRKTKQLGENTSKLRFSEGPIL
jgi:hypothetical protein